MQALQLFGFHNTMRKVGGCCLTSVWLTIAGFDLLRLCFDREQRLAAVQVMRCCIVCLVFASLLDCR